MSFCLFLFAIYPVHCNGHIPMPSTQRTRGEQVEVTYVWIILLITNLSMQRLVNNTAGYNMITTEKAKRRVHDVPTTTTKQQQLGPAPNTRNSRYFLSFSVSFIFFSPPPRRDRPLLLFLWEKRDAMEHVTTSELLL